MLHRLLDRLERRFGRFAIPNLTLVIIAFQVLFWLTAVGTTGQAFLDNMALVWDRVFAGEVWLLLTFMFMPRVAHPLWFLIAIYIFWLMGSALDREWGHFRYNVYLLTAFVLSALAGLLDPAAPVTNYYVLISVLFAFAWLYPEIQFLLFFIVPVKVKWIGIVVAVITAGWFLQALGMRQWQEAAVLAAGVANFFLFFGGEMITRARNAHRRRAYETEQAERAEQPFHKCVVCGRTDKSDPDMEFRYCPQCSDAACYCMDHIFEHEHR